MKNVEELRKYFKNQLSDCKHVKDNSLTCQINECIQFYWDEWDDEVTRPFWDAVNKPQRYTKSFMEDWIDSEINEEDLEWWKEEGSLPKV